MKQKHIIFYICLVYILMLLTGELLVLYIRVNFTLMLSFFLGVSMGIVIMLPYKWRANKTVKRNK